MAFGVHSEVGKLRKVMVHRPGLEHTRLTPSNAEELLFDDVLWVEQAKQRARRLRRGRCASAASRSSRPRQLLAEALVEPEGQGLGRRPHPERARGRHRRVRPGARVGRRGRARRGRRLPDRRHHQGGRRAGRRPGLGVGRPDDDAAAAAAQLPVPARPVLLDLRRRHAQPDGQAGPQAGDDDRGGDLPLPPDVRRPSSFPIWLGGADEDWGRCHVEGGDVQPIGNGAVMIGMGERTTPQAVLLHRTRRCSGPTRPTRCWPSTCRSRAATCTSTPSSRCATATSVTPFPQVVDGARIWAIRPGDAPDDLVIEESAGPLRRAHGARPSASPTMRVVDDRRRRVRGRARAVGRRQQRRRPRARRGRRLRAQHLHQHRAAQGGHRGHHDRGLRAGPGPRRLATA